MAPISQHYSEAICICDSDRGILGSVEMLSDPSEKKEVVEKGRRGWGDGVAVDGVVFTNCCCWLIKEAIGAG